MLYVIYFHFDLCTLFKIFVTLLFLNLVHFSKGLFMASGGARLGSGRKKGIKTKPIRVPCDIYYFVKILSTAVRETPEKYEYLFDSNRALYMLSCLDSNPPIALVSRASRFKKKAKKNK